MSWLHLICPNYWFSNLFAFPFGFWYFVRISCLDEHLRITLFWYMHWSPSAIQVTTYPFKIFLFKTLLHINTTLLMTPSLFKWLKTPTHSELNENLTSCATQSLHIFNKCLTYSSFPLPTGLGTENGRDRLSTRAVWLQSLRLNYCLTHNLGSMPV